MDKKFRSCAEWDSDIPGFHQNNITTDLHETEDQAKAVCRGLERTGLGGEGKHFPKRTWTENLADDIERIAKG